MESFCYPVLSLLVSRFNSVGFFSPHSMAANRIISKVGVGSVLKSGNSITLSVATKTDLWERPTTGVAAVSPGFKKAAEAFRGDLPGGTAELISREAECFHFISEAYAAQRR